MTMPMDLNFNVVVCSRKARTQVGIAAGVAFSTLALAPSASQLGFAAPNTLSVHTRSPAAVVTDVEAYREAAQNAQQMSGAFDGSKVISTSKLAGTGFAALVCFAAAGMRRSNLDLSRKAKVQRQFFPGMGGPPGPPGPSPAAQQKKSPARLITDGNTGVKFRDVAGCDKAKEELMEVVDFLKNGKKYTDMGAKLPKGALLCGPPGTGKTLLAKAVAGESGVPFYSISASEFVEIYAGVGASRVRDLFNQAKASAPCIIFIDEIDAVGRQRAAGFGQGNDEREQTVNQLLTEMDGFQQNNGIVVIAATNRADVLDSALVRPGRFDRSIQVDAPDLEGRIAILKVHAINRSLAPEVDLSKIARSTPGMTGADLQNLLNEGAIVAARARRLQILNEDIFNALDRINIGLERKGAVMSDRKKKLVAYHEAGHAILGALMDDFDAVSKISIVPRGPTGGVTVFMPSEERLNSGLMTKQFLENRICVALGGRIAEELLNGKDNVTTGASNDFMQATQVATAMVTQFGMSDAVRARFIGSSGGAGPFMGRDFMSGGAPPVSQKMKRKIDQEVRRFVEEQYNRGKYLLTQNKTLLDNLSALLIEKEKVSGDELVKLISDTASGKVKLVTQYKGSMARV